MKEPKVKYYERTDGDWGWTLVGANGEPQASGEGYASEAGCLRGITDAKRNMAVANLVKVKRPAKVQTEGRISPHTWEDEQESE